MDEEAVDVVVVGAGIAGLVCAYQLGAAGRSVVLVERGPAPGTKNLSGGVLYCRVMEQVFPGFVERAPVERVITRNTLTFLNRTSSVAVDYWDQHLAQPGNAVTVLRAKLDAWLAEQCEEVGVMVMPGVRVDALVREGEQIVGVRAGDDVLRARVVVAADGVNSFLCQEAGIRGPANLHQLAVGVKSVIGMPRAAIEDRFHLVGDEGVAFAVVGDCTDGVGGGGFLYTNTESVSIGVVLRLDDLVAQGKSSSDLHDRFLSHPAIAPYLAAGELLEYGCHLVAEGGKAMVHDLARPGLVVIGDAAGLTLNTGFTVRGMDLAAGSAVEAARAVDAALEANDFTQEAMDGYVRGLRASFVGQDMDTYSRAPSFLENPRMYGDYGALLADVMRGVYDLDLTPRRRLLPTARRALRRSPVSLRTLVGDGLAAVRSL